MKRPWLVIAAAALLLELGALALVHSQRQRTAEFMAHELLEHFEDHLDGMAGGAEALALLVQEQQQAPDRFDISRHLPAWRRTLDKLLPSGSILELAPGGILQAMEPPPQDQRWRGLDLIHDPSNSAASAIALRTRAPQLLGPVRLPLLPAEYPGGEALIVRQPVYLGPQQRFWGFAQVLVPWQPLQAQWSGLVSARYSEFQLAWQLQDGTGQRHRSAPLAPGLPWDHWRLSADLPLGAQLQLQLRPPYPAAQSALLLLAPLLGGSAMGLVLQWQAARARRQELEQQRRLEPHRLLYESGPVGLMMCDDHLRLAAANPAAVTLFGCRSERELLALDLIEQLSPPRQPDGRTSLEVVQERLPRFLQEGSGSFDFVHRRFHSGELWTARVQMFQSSHHQDNGLNFAVITDVSAERSAEQRLRQLAMQDQRSLLPNRLALLEWWQQRSTEQPDQRWLVLNLDLDDFRAVNEVLGVPAADALLVAIAADLQAVLEEERQAGRQGAFLAHLESDEFVLLMAAEQGSAAGFPADMIERWSAQLRELVHRCAARESPAVASLSFCLGCAWVRADPEAPEQVLQKANIALLHAKREGPGSTTIYNQQMAGGIQERLDLQAALQRALNQAPAPAGLELVYQPQIDGQGRLLGAEALLRFRTEQGRAVPPDQLVRLAERTGQIRQLGLQVLRRVCQQLVQWRGLEVGVIAINVSARQLERQPGQATFLNHALAMLQAYDLQPQQFCLEVTETALLGSDQALLSELQALRGAGFGLSLDDFGTGYSAMAILRDYPLSEFKIDRSFVQDLRQRSDSQAILACMAQLADRLGLDCVVEGVESEEQWLLLQRFGLSRFQGYWCSPPLDPEAFEAFVRTHGRPASELTP